MEKVVGGSYTENNGSLAVVTKVREISLKSVVKGYCRLVILFVGQNYLYTGY